MRKDKRNVGKDSQQIITERKRAKHAENMGSDGYLNLKSKMQLRDWENKEYLKSKNARKLWEKQREKDVLFRICVEFKAHIFLWRQDMKIHIAMKK